MKTKLKKIVNSMIFDDILFQINETAKKLAKKIIELKKAKQNDKAKNVHHDLSMYMHN